MAVGEEIPDIKKPDLQILLQDLAQSRRDVYEERRNKDREVAGERERARWEIDKLRTESGEKVRGLERENDALIRALGRIQAENDRLREENAILRHTKNGTVSEEPAKPAEKKEQKTLPEALRGPAPLFPSDTAAKPTLITPGEPPLGKTIPLDPTKR